MFDGILLLLFILTVAAVAILSCYGGSIKLFIFSLRGDNLRQDLNKGSIIDQLKDATPIALLLFPVLIAMVALSCFIITSSISNEAIYLYYIQVAALAVFILQMGVIGLIYIFKREVPLLSFHIKGVPAILLGLLFILACLFLLWRLYIFSWEGK